MSRTKRRQKYFDNKSYIDSWFEDTEHRPFEMPNWARVSLSKRLENKDAFKKHVFSDNYSLTHRSSSYVKTESKKIVRCEKRKMLHDVKKNAFIDTPTSNNKKNNLKMLYI